VLQGYQQDCNKEKRFSIGTEDTFSTCRVHESCLNGDNIEIPILIYYRII